MKKIPLLALCLVVTTFLPGCLIEMLMTTAISADMAAQNAASSTGAMSQADLDMAQLQLESAVGDYYIETGAYPTTLNLLVPVYVETIPTRPDGESFGYNPVTGQIFPNNLGPTPEDYLKMEAIKTAINNYGTATGYYPPKLDDIYPTYLPSLPRTSTFEPFGYDNQNGQLTHPHEGRQFATESTQPGPAAKPVKPANAIGSLQEGDLRDSNSLNKSLDRIGY